MTFMQQLACAWQAQHSLLCVGLDPLPTRMPVKMASDADGIFIFCRDIIDATHDLVCAFKPQIAHFAALGAETSLERIIAYIHQTYPDIPVILDAKRGDIGSTAEKYANEAFERYQADAVTANPYLGHDSLAPFLAYKNKGVFILARTSNPGSGEFQDLDVHGQPLFLHVARTIAEHWNQYGNCALVAGATYPEELGQIRQIIGDMPMLVPGIGTQGGDVGKVLAHGLDATGKGLILSSSRAVLYASKNDDYANAARQVAMNLRNLFNQQR